MHESAVLFVSSYANHLYGAEVGLDTSRWSIGMNEHYKTNP